MSARYRDATSRRSRDRAITVVAEIRNAESLEPGMPLDHALGERRDLHSQCHANSQVRMGCGLFRALMLHS